MGRRKIFGKRKFYGNRYINKNKENINRDQNVKQMPHEVLDPPHIVNLECPVIKREPIEDTTVEPHCWDGPAVKLERTCEITIEDHGVQLPEEYTSCSLKDMLTSTSSEGIQSGVAGVHCKDQELLTQSISNMEENFREEKEEGVDDTDMSDCASGATSDEPQTEARVFERQPTSQKNVLKRKKQSMNIVEATYDFMKVCTSSLAGSNALLNEYDVTGLSVARKLQRMDPVQAVYAESIINNVLRRGLLKTLQYCTDVCDNQC